MLTNVIYIGKVLLDGEEYDGEHDSIIDGDNRDAVETQLSQKRRRDPPHRRRWKTLLGGLLFCGRCGSGMYRHHTSKGKRHYGSYVCGKYSKGRAAACPGSRVPADEIEQFVVERIRGIGRDPALVAETLRAAKAAEKEHLPDLIEEQERLDQRRRNLCGECENLLDAIAAGAGSGQEGLLRRRAKVEGKLATTDQRVREVRREIRAIRTAVIDEADMRAALAEFDGLWNQLATKEQAHVLALLIENVTYDGSEEEVAISFRPEGVRHLAGHGGEPG